METGKREADADNHNTNQNETTCACPPVFVAQECPNQPPTISVGDNSIQNVSQKESQGVYGEIPTIIISPASPVHNRSDDTNEDNERNNSKDNVQIFRSRSDEKIITVSRELATTDDETSGPTNVCLLELPKTDDMLNVSRPPDVSMDQTHCMDTSNEDDIEVICRYSSTPKRPSSQTDLDTTAPTQGTPNIEDASPIAPGTPTGDSNNPASHIQDDEEEQEPSKVTPSSLMQPFMGQSASPQEGTCPVPSSYDCPRGPSPGFPGMCSGSAGGYHNYNVFPSYMQAHGGYNDYCPGNASSWTDLSYRPDISSVPGSSQATPCCYPGLDGAPSDNQCFVYPSIYVSSAGLISLLLKNDISVEMTVDRTIRVVSHNHMMAVATDSKGTAACLYHPAIKVFQTGTTTDIATDNFRARMSGGDAVIFSNGSNFFKLQESELQPTAPVKFSDILRDQSVNLLFSSEGYGESLVSSCMSVAAQAEYANLPKGGVIVRINGVKVTQTGQGDVTVVTGSKFIRLSPMYGTTRLGNRFVDMEVEKDWSVKLTHGLHTFSYSKKRAMVCNGKMEAGFDEYNGLKVVNLMPRHPLFPNPSMPRRPTRKVMRPQFGPATPTRRLGGPMEPGRGGGLC